MEEEVVVAEEVVDQIEATIEEMEVVVEALAEALPEEPQTELELAAVQLAELNLQLLEQLSEAGMEAEEPVEAVDVEA